MANDVVPHEHLIPSDRLVDATPHHEDTCLPGTHKFGQFVGEAESCSAASLADSLACAPGEFPPSSAHSSNT